MSGEPGTPDAATLEKFRLAQDLYAGGRLPDAAKLLSEILQADPTQASAFHLLGLTAFRLQQPDQGIGLLSQAIALQPGEASPRIDRAVMNLALGRLPEALEDGDEAARLEPARPDILLVQGDVLARLQRLDDALASYDAAATLSPAAEPLNRRGGALQAVGRLEDAAASYEAAVAREPANAAAHRGRGNALYGLGRLQEALASFEQAIALEPSNPVAHYNRGNVLKLLTRFDESLASYDAAIALNPDFAVAHHNRALCLLHMGELAQGFAEYEWRKRCPTFEDPRYDLDRPLVPGADLQGKTLFIYPEFYQGDVIQFCRYARTAERQGARVILAAPAPMHRLLQTLSPTVELAAPDAVPEAFDLQCALLSLPHAFGTGLEDLPLEAPYLQAEEARVERWRARIGGHGFKIGVMWQGSTLPYSIPLQRSFPLAALEGIGRVPGVRLISLQKFNGLDQLADLPAGMAVETLGEDFDPGPDAFLDTAAAMACCDLLIVMDTSVAHLAGALGCKSWVALPYIADWRWLIGRADCPWYPSQRLFRQHAPNDWTSVFSDMETALRAELVSAQKP